MIKKILGAILTVTVLAGLPSFVMAGCSADNSYITYSESACPGAGGTWTPAPTVNSVTPITGSVTQGAPANNPITGSATQGTPFGASGVSTPLANPIKFNTFSEFVAQVTKTAVDILMPFVVLAFIWSGFLFVRAQGNEKELEEAKSAIKWSIVGAFILLGAWGFAQIIGTTIKTITN